MKKNISIITNFGCRSDCWYCVWKEHPLKNVQLDTDWDKLENFLSDNKKKKKVSVSGGGDCLYEYSKYENWWGRIFEICEKLNMKIDVHSREKFYNETFWRKINKCVFSSDNLNDDIGYLNWICKLTKLRITHVVTANTTLENILEYKKFQNETKCQLTIKKLVGYNDNGNYECFKKKFFDIFYLDAGDYNIYYMPDNTITEKFLS